MLQRKLRRFCTFVPTFSYFLGQILPHLVYAIVIHLTVIFATLREMLLLTMHNTSSCHCVINFTSISRNVSTYQSFLESQL
jgi:hypothetical protein